MFERLHRFLGLTFRDVADGGVDDPFGNLLRRGYDISTDISYTHDHALGDALDADGQSRAHLFGGLQCALHDVFGDGQSSRGDCVRRLQSIRDRVAHDTHDLSFDFVDPFQAADDMSFTAVPTALISVLSSVPPVTASCAMINLLSIVLAVSFWDVNVPPIALLVGIRFSLLSTGVGDVRPFRFRAAPSLL
jgi:hypothetical protein